MLCVYWNNENLYKFTKPYYMMQLNTKEMTIDFINSRYFVNL